MALNLTFYLVLILFTYIYIFITIIFIGMMAIIVPLIVKGLRHPEKEGFWWYFGETLSATNVFVRIPAKSLPSEIAGNIVISAHLDTKSQSFKTAWRIVLYRVWLFSGIILGGFYVAVLINSLLQINQLNLVNLIWFNWLIQFGFLILIILISISNIFLMFLTTHNKSPGALDNASGMAIVFELSSYFKDRPLDNFNLWFCQFSAEELGTMGSRVFVNNHENQFEIGKIFQLNFDMISSACHSEKKNVVGYLKSYGIFPRKQIAPILNKFLDKAAREEKIRINGFHLSTGAHLDSVPFHLRGYDAVDITTRAAALWTHNKIDTPDKVDPKVLLEACNIAKNVTLALDKDYEELCEVQELKGFNGNI